MADLSTMIQNQLYDGTDYSEDIKDFALHLSEVFINPLSKLGFEFEEYSYADLTKNDGGVHVLEFDYPLDTLSKANEKKMDEICTQDDDSQPEANYRMWLGSLWLFIPYKS